MFAMMVDENKALHKVLHCITILGSSSGGRLFGMEWSLQCNDQFPEKNQAGGQ